MGKTAIVYLRTSSQAQAQAETITAQRERCRVLVERHGLTLVPYGTKKDGWVEDDGVSGTLLEGRRFGALIDDLRQGRLKVDHLVVFSLSRIARVDTTSDDTAKQIKSAEDNARISAVLRIAGLQVIDETGIKQPGTIPFELEMNMGTMQHATIIRTTRAGRISRLERGQAAFGGPIYGYARVGDKREGKRLVPDPEQVEHLRRILGWFAKGGAFFAARKATEAGIPTPRQRPNKRARADWSPTTWDRSTIEKMAARAQSYASGTITVDYFGKSYSIEAEPIISHTLAAQVEQRLKIKTPKRPPQNLGTGYLTCGDCGKGIRYAPGRRYQYVQCVTCKRMTRGDHFDARLRAALTCRLIQIQMVERVRSRHDYDARLAAIDTEIADVNAKIATLLDARINGLDRDVWQKRNDALNASKTRLLAEAEQVRAAQKAAAAETARKGTVYDQVQAVLWHLQEDPNLDLPDVRRYLGELLGGERIAIKWRTTTKGKKIALTIWPAWGSLAEVKVRMDRRVWPQMLPDHTPEVVPSWDPDFARAGQ